MATFHGQIGHSRTELEQSSVDTANTSDAVAVITNVQALKRNMKGWEKQASHISKDIINSSFLQARMIFFTFESG